MKRTLSMVALLGLTAFAINLSAQRTSSQPGQQDDSAQQQQHTDSQRRRQTTRNFEGRIAKSGDQYVLREATTQTVYGLDDQVKAKQFQGKTVIVMATMDPATNTLHVVAITPSDTQ